MILEPILAEYISFNTSLTIPILSVYAGRLLTFLIAFAILLIGIPAGLGIAYFASDELIIGRKWFIALTIAAILAAAVFFLLGRHEIAFSTAFIAIVSVTGYIKSFDYRWTRRHFS